jgi:hypothetical protein
MAKIVIKLGGQVFSQGDAYLQDIASDLVALKNAGHQLILVHGGGVLIDAELAKGGSPMPPPWLSYNPFSTELMKTSPVNSIPSATASA